MAPRTALLLKVLPVTTAVAAGVAPTGVAEVMAARQHPKARLRMACTRVCLRRRIWTMPAAEAVGEVAVEDVARQGAMEATHRTLETRSLPASELVSARSLEQWPGMDL